MPERWERMSADCFRLVRHPYAALVWWVEDDFPDHWHWSVERRLHVRRGITAGYRFLKHGEEACVDVSLAAAKDELDAHAPKETE